MIRKADKPHGRDDEALHRKMLAETNAFLNWAMREGHNLPRIPRRRVDEGGFSELLRRPAGRQAVQRWWLRVLNEAFG